MPSQISVRIDGELCTATEGQTIFEVAEANGKAIPVPVPPGRGELRRLLPPVPGRGRGARPPAARLHHPGPARHVGHHQLGPPAQHRLMALELLFIERNHICAVCVSNGHCELQALAQTLGSPTSATPTTAPPAGGRVASALRPRPQSLHPVHALRAGLRRDRGGARLGHRRPRHRLDGWWPNSNRPWGESRILHQLRQMRPGLPDRRAGREGPCGRGDDQAATTPSPDWPARKGPRHEKGKTGDDVARRLLRMPHVAARHRRGDHRHRREGGPGVRAAGRRPGISRTTSTSPSSRAPSAARTTWRGSARCARNARILVALGDCAVTGNVPAMRNPFPVKAILERVYVDGADVEQGHPHPGSSASAQAGAFRCTTW